MKIVADACSLIILGKVTLLRSLCNWQTILVTSAVNDEVLKGAEIGAADALIYKQLSEEKMVKIENAEGAPLEAKFGLGKGEAASIALKIKHSAIDLILTDNRQGRKVANALNLPVVGTLELLAAMYKKKAISKEKALTAINEAEEMNWFKPELIKRCREVVENE